MSGLKDIEPLLSVTDKHSNVWIKLMQYQEKRLQLLRSQNDQAIGEMETAKLRGRIHEIKAFLKLNEDAPIIE